MDMSVRLRRCTSCSQLELSSQEKVLHDDDLLTQILIYVPYRKLKSFKCVSRRWFRLITAPRFTSLCSLLHPLRTSGLFIQRPIASISGRPCCNKGYFIPLDDPNTPSPYKTLKFDHDPFDPKRILGSCNGLLLCSTCVLAPWEENNTCVYNPSTNQLATLPRCFNQLGTLPQCRPVTGLDVYLNLAFDPSKSPHYKVIAFVTTPQSGSIGDFYIYSSQTQTWRLSVQSFYRAPGINLEGGVYWHGCIHWLGDFNFKSVPGSTVSDGLYFNVDEDRLGTFPGPHIDMKLSSIRSYFGESEDHLHFIGVGPSVTSLSVYEMKSDYSEWFIKYWIDLAPISKVFPEMTQIKARSHHGNKYTVAVLSLIRREDFQEDSFLVLEIPGKAIRYNLVDRTFKVIWDYLGDVALEEDDDIHLWFCGKFSVWPYIEDLSFV